MYDLTNVTFLISLKIDSLDRKNNLDIVIPYLQKYFTTKVIICEQDTKPKFDNKYNCDYIFIKTDNFFNRQRGTNIAAKKATTPIIVHYDADVLLSPEQILKAVESISTGQHDIVYPYDGRFYDVPKEFHPSIKNTLTTNSIILENCGVLHTQSVGGAVFFKTEVFWNGGGANENFRGLGFEDNEIYERYSRLDYKIGRMSGPLLHLTHERNETSFYNNPHGPHNYYEYQRIISLSKPDLLKEIKSWDRNN